MRHPRPRLPGPDPAVVQVVRSRQENDCALISLCSLTGLPYEDALIQVARIDKAGGKRGLWFTQLKRVAALYRIELRYKRRADLEEDTGILNISFPGRATDHAVILKRGQILEAECVWDVEVYLATYKAKAGGLLYMVTTPEADAA